MPAFHGRGVPLLLGIEVERGGGGSSGQVGSESQPTRRDSSQTFPGFVWLVAGVRAQEVEKRRVGERLVAVEAGALENAIAASRGVGNTSRASRLLPMPASPEMSRTPRPPSSKASRVASSWWRPMTTGVLTGPTGGMRQETSGPSRRLRHFRARGPSASASEGAGAVHSARVKRWVLWDRIPPNRFSRQLERTLGLAGPSPGTPGPTSPASHASSCPSRRRRRLPEDMRRGRGQELRGLHNRPSQRLDAWPAPASSDRVTIGQSADVRRPVGA